MSRLAPLARRCGGQDGFTLLEVVVAMVLLAIGMLGAASAVSVQMSGGLASAATTGLGAINRSNVISTAVMLAQERIEQLKGDAQWTGGALSAATGCPPGASSGYVCTENRVTNFATYARTTTVQTDGGLPTGTYGSRTVTVEVTYQSVGDVGTSFGGKVTLATVIAQRP